MALRMMQITKRAMILLSATAYIWWICQESAWLSALPLAAIGSSTQSSSLSYAVTAHPVLKNTIRPGELPGYTGWARPTTTLANSFRIHRPYPISAQAGSRWTCSVHCSHALCATGGSLFYTRAYGPSVLPGLITDHHNGTYDVTFLPMDEGLYTVEVVLTFSTPPPFAAFPLPKFSEPGYEGYQLPEFPISLVVETADTSSARARLAAEDGSLPLCTMSDLLESSPTSGIETGRWLVHDKIIERVFNISKSTNEVTLDGYRRGDNSLGIKMDFYPAECSLLSEAECKDRAYVKKALQESKRDNSRELHLLMIGDSNMRIQSEMARDENFLLSNGPDRITYISTHGGLYTALPSVASHLAQIFDYDKDRNTDHVVIFNSGLQELVYFCGSNYFGVDLTIRDRGTGPCTDAYRRVVTEFVELIQQIPSILTIFQTTPAAWPKWGLYGGLWPAEVLQPMPYCPDFVDHFNQIVWQILKQKEIMTMDAYFLTLSRPDHREVLTASGHELSARLAHAGPEVYTVLVRMWTSMIHERLKVF